MSFSAASTAPSSSKDVVSSTSFWNLSIKLVGGKNLVKIPIRTIPQPTLEESETTTPTQSESSTPSLQTSSSTETATEEGDSFVKDEFTVSVQPHDELRSLYDKIEEETGLKQCQQRLIYRGRILNTLASTTTSTSSDSPEGRQDDSQEEEDAVATKKQVTIQDVSGLADGQTIHLVPRPMPPSAEDGSNTAAGEGANADGSDPVRVTRMAGPVTEMTAAAPLLAAILGLGSSLAVPTPLPRDGGAATTTAAAAAPANNNGDSNNDNASDEDVFMDPSQILPVRPPRRARRRPNSHRLTAEDPIYPSPGPLEPVRQSLMTMRTMLDASPVTGRNHNAQKPHSDGKHPLSAQRTFYKGQWIDCRDTVHQWLEATIVEVKHPAELLKSVSTSGTTTAAESQSAKLYIPKESTASDPRQMQDPAIGANDDAGRRGLLIEQATNEEDTSLSDVNGSDPTLVGWKERSNNQNLHLLLIHYNGWPNRWDEWIRSDSERIRPFRTRSKPTGRSGQTIYGNERLNCPVPCSSFSTAPSTFIVENDDILEGIGAMRELQLVFDDVQGLFKESLPAETFECLDVESDDLDVSVPLTVTEVAEVYVALSMLSESEIDDVFEILRDPYENATANHLTKQMSVNDIDVSSLNASVQRKLQIYLNCGSTPSNTQKEPTIGDGTDIDLPWDKKMLKLRNKEPMFTEIDSESEVAKEDDDGDTALKNNNKSLDTVLSKIDKRKLTSLAPLLDRLGRALVDIAPHIATVAEEIPESQKGDTKTKQKSDKDRSNVKEENGRVSVKEEESSESIGTKSRSEGARNKDEEDELTEAIKKAMEEFGAEDGAEDCGEVQHTLDESCEDQNASNISENINEGEGELQKTSSSQTSTTQENGPLSSIFSADGTNRELRPSWSPSFDAASVPLLAEDSAEDVFNDGIEVDPDYIDFVNGFVNTSDSNSNARRVVRRAGGSDDGIGPSLLSAYLASTGSPSDGNRENVQDAPRVVRLGSNGSGGNRAQGSGNGSGIDIHIHAFVTGAGGGITAMPGVPGLDGLGFLSSPSTDSATVAGAASNTNEASDNSNDQRTAGAPELDEDDMALFSDLYTDDPSNSHDHSDGPTTGVNERSGNNDNQDSVNSRVDNLSSNNSSENDTRGPNDISSHAESTNQDEAASSQDRRNRQANRSPLMGRFFRRALSRRFNSNGSQS